MKKMEKKKKKNRRHKRTDVGFDVVKEFVDSVGIADVGVLRTARKHFPQPV